MAEIPLLRQHPLFADGSPADLEQIEQRVRVRTYSDGGVIFYQEDPGDGLYVVKSGGVKIALTTPEGQESLIALMAPGDCFGELAVLDGEPRSAMAVALGPTEAYFLRRADYLEFLDRSPAVARRVIRMLCHRLRLTDQQVADLVFFDVYGRVAKKLLDLAETHGRKTPDGVVIELALTQQDLAKLIGASRESVNKVLRFYREVGYIGARGQHIVVRRPDALQRRIV